MAKESGRRWSPAAGAATATSPEASRGDRRGQAYGQPFGATERKDAWWLVPLAQATGLTLLGIYATWSALQGDHYEFGNYLSPFYSPLFKPSWWPLSPALLILAFPGGFRATCYYYRKAYYRAFFADPTACAVGEPWKGYRGEKSFPFILQNLHRYFLYAALVFLVFLWWDVIKAFTFDGRFGIGGGSLAILFNTSLLSLYTFSCHSLRHLIGGNVDCFSCAVAGGPRRQGWLGVSWLNEHHMAWAWWSLFAVCFADFYVRMCSMGIFHDPRFL